MLRISLLGVLGFLLLRNISLAELSESMKSVDWRLVALAALLNVTLNSLGRVERFSFLLRKLSSLECLGEYRVERPIGFRNLAELLYATRTLNLVLPARMGEVFRFNHLHQKGYSLASVGTALVIEALIESIALGCLVPIALLALRGSLGSPFFLILFLILGATLLGFAGFIALNRWTAARVRDGSEGYEVEGQGAEDHGVEKKTRRERLIRALHLTSRPGLLIPALGWTWFADFIDLLTIGLCLNAIPIHIGVASWFLVILTVNLAIALPIVPGNIGMHEGGAMLALAAFQVSHQKALTFAVVYHATQALPIAAVGLWALHVLTLQKR
jgi:uncharacterized protein (TIRG00374 family)